MANDHSNTDMQQHLPVTPVAFEILLALGTEDRHGYSIMQDVAERTNGNLLLHPGTLYRTMSRLLESGLIEELDERPDPDIDDERRRYYRITTLGRKVAAAEAARLEKQLATARARKILKARRV
jgi:DNA-binding PadR family transcriptional regulator